MKNVLITGVGRGIGKALALKFLSEGYFVVGTATSGGVDYANENLRVFKLDLSQDDSISSCVQEISRLNIFFDILINNAGVLFDEDDAIVIKEKLRKTLEVNLIGTIDFTERVLPFMAVNSHIVQISSSAGSIERTGHKEGHFEGFYPAYKISKAALNMYIRTLALRLKDKTASAVHPGWVKTDMGGEEANITPEEAAENIFKFSVSKPETGGFWFNGEKMLW